MSHHDISTILIFRHVCRSGDFASFFPTHEIYFKMVSCGTMFIGSFAIPLIAPDNSFDEWRKVFPFCLIYIKKLTNSAKPLPKYSFCVT